MDSPGFVRGDWAWTMGFATAVLVFLLLVWVYVVLHWMGKTVQSDTVVERMNPYGASFSHALTRGALFLGLD